MNQILNTQANPQAPWGGVKNITRVARDKGIPPSVEKWMIKLNKFLRGCPPFLLSDVGRAISPPITEGLDELPSNTKKTVAIVGSGLAGMITALELAKLKMKNLKTLVSTDCCFHYVAFCSLPYEAHNDPAAPFPRPNCQSEKSFGYSWI